MWYLRLLFAFHIALTIAQVVAFGCTIGALDLQNDLLKSLFEVACVLRWVGAVFHVIWLFYDIDVELMLPDEQAQARRCQSASRIEMALTLGLCLLIISWVLQFVLLFTVIQAEIAFVLWNPAMGSGLADTYIGAVLFVCWAARWIALKLPARAAAFRASAYRFCCASPWRATPPPCRVAASAPLIPAVDPPEPHCCL